MTPLRQRMVEDMQIRTLAPATQRAYVEYVAQFARHFGRSPADVGPEEIRAFQVHLLHERHVAPRTLIVAVAALRFLYTVTLKSAWPVDVVVPAPTVIRRLPVVLSPAEVAHVLACAPGLKHRTILTTCYAAGLRIAEAVRLTVSALDRQRMMLRVEQGTGRRDRSVMLSPRLLALLREWWRVGRPRLWLFPGPRPDHPITTKAVNRACRRAHRRSGLTKPVTPHALRHAFAVHLLEAGTDVRTLQLLLGHRNLETTATYLRIATTKVCATPSPLDLLPRPLAASPDLPPPPAY
ncbi:MAG TPA: site-specific integrase [Vicinamibacterales bacterium]|nr:site-specific integrase [Vicinamibacterales bacterium]